MNLKPESLRFLVWVGLADVVLGLGLFLWGRNNLSKAERRRGDLN